MSSRTARRARSAWAPAALALILTLPGAALADRLVMKNGDVITGNISLIDDDEVTIEPPYTDEFSVDLADVSAIETDEEFDVVLVDGREAPARFAGGADGQQTLIVEEKSYQISLDQIDMAEEPEPWYERDSRVDLNVTARDGNTDSSNVLLFADTTLRFGDHRHLGELTFARDEVDGIKTKKQDLFRYEYNWLFNDPWYLGATASFERDPIKDLDHRYTLGALVGRDIIDDGTKFLTISLGAGWSEEELGGVTDSGAVGLWSLNYTHDFRDGDFAFFHNHKLNYQFYGVNNAIFKSNTGFRYDIWGDIYANLSLRYDYETEPAPDTKSYDATLAIGIGAEF
jgi:putative salt-induced outer membrane protein YdiY